MLKLAAILLSVLSVAMLLIVYSTSGLIYALLAASILVVLNGVAKGKKV
ncbi:MAG TPA: hypothetical protein VN030_00535 [Cellvibrio sp.]|nr:hypothetical protein [Cellvibrio sp.]